jgi:UrcA family protein
MAIKLIIAAAAVALLASPAAAQYVEPKQDLVRVSSEGLDLGTDAGAQEMLRRIHAASQTVCGPQPEKIELGRHRRWEACVAETQSEAVLALRSAKVSELAASELGRAQILVR